MGEYADIEKRFRGDTANHEMAVLHDDGVYRHVRFAQPDQRGYWFSLTTWPQKLVINGSVGTYVFSRMEDMFEFFRDSCPTGVPNFSYWAEKIVAGSDPVPDFSQDLFNKHVADDLAEAEKDYPGVTAEWDDKVNGFFAEYDTTYEHGAQFALHDFEYRPRGAKAGDEPFRFCDTGDWKLSDYDWKYLWCCHAIRWGIAQYDAGKKVAADLGGEVATS